MITNPHLIAELIHIHEIADPGQFVLRPGIHFAVQSLSPDDIGPLRMILAEMVEHNLLRDRVAEIVTFPIVELNPSFVPIPYESIQPLLEAGINVFTLLDGKLMIIGTRFVDSNNVVRHMGDQLAHNGYLEPLKTFINESYNY
jgi:hypothetical protein